VFIRDSINWEAWLDRAQKAAPLNSGASQLLALLRDPVAAVIGRGRTADHGTPLPAFEASRWGLREQVAAAKPKDYFVDRFELPSHPPLDLTGQGRPAAFLAAAPSESHDSLPPSAFSASLEDLPTQRA
jgi:hypothetical protein